MPLRSNTRTAKVALTASLLLALLVVIALVVLIDRPSRSVADAAPPPDLAVLEAVQNGLTWIADTVKPAVVFIEAEEAPLAGRPGAGSQPGPFVLPPDFVPAPDVDPDRLPPGFRDWYRDFFGPGGPAPSPRGQQPMPRLPAVGQGSGVVIDPDGYILTNHHVVGKAGKIQIHLPSGETYTGDLVGTDKLSDLAVIKIDPDQPLVAAKLGDADDLNVGNWAMAIGYPFGARGLSSYGGGSGRFDEPLRYEPTVTVGIISALDRQIESNIPGRPFRHLIQTDAPINPGNSGGALLNIRGEVIGINQAIFTSRLSGGNVGVGFAIPIDTHTKQVIEALKGGEPVVRGQLGVLVSPLTPAIKGVYGVDSGIFVEEVLEDTPADRAGLKAEDVITKFGGSDVTSVDWFVTRVQNSRPGATVKIGVIRDGKPMTLDVTIEALSLEVAQRERAPVERDRLGLTVETIPPEIREETGLSGGVRVATANPVGDAVRAGIKRGDVILKINRQPITDVESYTHIVAQLKPGDPVVIRSWRDGRTLTAQIARLSE